MRRRWSIFAVTALPLALTACSGMSKGKAKDLLQKRFDDDGNVYCRLRDQLSQQEGGVWGGLEKACIEQLASAGFVTDTGCAEHFESRSSGCLTWGFKPAKSNIEKNKWLAFACGAKTLGEVKSVTTEGKRATVKYARTFKLDQTKASLTSCVIAPLQEGEREGTATFVQDDSGDWSEDR